MRWLQSAVRMYSGEFFGLPTFVLFVAFGTTVPLIVSASTDGSYN